MRNRVPTPADKTESVPDPLPQSLAPLPFRVGFGYDVHRLAINRRLVIGGVEIPNDRGLDGHSDADVLVHAMMDSILGALNLGDIGQHFPVEDPRFKDADSLNLLTQVGALMRQHGYLLGNCDAVVVAERPRLQPYVSTMRCRLAPCLAVSPDRISIKATTNEKVGFIGRNEGIAAMSTVLLVAAEQERQP